MNAKTDVLAQLRRLRIVPVIVIDEPKNAVGLANALTEGGLPCAEVTFRTANAVEALERMVGENPDILAGAGTVLSREQAEAARKAGAKFVVAPGFNPVVVDYCLENDIPVFPGVCTPTEIEMALTKGLTTVKFFPAEPIGGLPYLKAIAAPYGMMEFIPTGGINTRNIGEYLAFQKIIACGGSWMAPAEWINAGEFERIQTETMRAVRAIGAPSGAVT
ncbi:MAG TPA: bifunctional 4-hydroxy-2-oxoglutarate aldolase/2-dehydro-3-deoxy-phosphogluconate aldolase [Longimicrobiales bacterium]|nr:bifunctional 4-hydroxy-2-oxoglutarate aldolase/2-dehydro-3-deoxy-phosphogluconate aldolase [Longimicrobiales bacterium]